MANRKDKAPDLVPRETRRPLYATVVTQPPLNGCWSVNISMSGMALMATRDSSSHGVGKGVSLAVELRLPDSGTTLQAHGRVVWRQESAGASDGAAVVAMGLLFDPATLRSGPALQHYLQGYRLHVAVSHATPAQRSLVEEALTGHASAYFSPNNALLQETLSRGHVSALLICGQHAAEARALIDEASDIATGTLPEGAPPREWTPQLCYLGAARPADLVVAFNERRLVAALPPDVTVAALRDAVLEACRDTEVRREYQRLAVDRARETLRRRALSRPAQDLDAVLEERMVVRSGVMRELVQSLKTIAPHRVSVLLQGETGTGKEVLAHALHDLSDRAHQPFVVADCGTLTETLLESELFGHVRGAFTGAVTDHPGLFLAADGGTVFLDEIENTTPKLQAALLRVLENGEVRPVGSRSSRRVDVRVVVACNRDLAADMARGRFRADLYYRLSAFPLMVPPLRERPDDLLPLAQHFLQRALQASGRPASGFTAGAIHALRAHAWPGNIRELRNAVERAAILARPGQPVDVDSLPAALVKAAAAAVREPGRQDPLANSLKAHERALIRAALDRHGGALRPAARELGMSHVTLGRKVRGYGLKPRETVKPPPR